MSKLVKQDVICIKCVYRMILSCITSEGQTGTLDEENVKHFYFDSLHSVTKINAK